MQNPLGSWLCAAFCFGMLAVSPLTFGPLEFLRMQGVVPPAYRDAFEEVVAAAYFPHWVLQRSGAGKILGCYTAWWTIPSSLHVSQSAGGE
jgi:hypothetical protein